MNLLNSRVSRIALACSFMAAVAAAQSARAQYVVDGDLHGETTLTAQIPMNDADCPFNGSYSVLSQPGCTVDGTRSVELQGVTREAADPDLGLPAGLDLVTGHYSVAFDGTLHVDGLPISTIPGSPNPWIFDYEQLFGSIDASVELAATYDAEDIRVVPTGAPTPAFSGAPAYPSWTSNFVTDVRAINVNHTGFFSSQDDREYYFDIASQDPDEISNGNSVALSGKFSTSEEIDGVLQFGKLTGTATLLTGNVITPYPSAFFGEGGAYRSTFGLVYDVAVEVTTQLDENGLITPQIAVTDGIEMNGSKITGLAAGTQDSDAVNFAQLKAATANFVTNNSGGPAPTARGQGAIAAGSGTSARGTGAIAMGYLNVAEGDGAVAIGDPNIATGKGAVAIGANNVANGNGSVAIGNGSIAAHSGNIAMGNAANADGSNAVALGSGSAALGNRSTAVGTGATAQGSDSVAIGYGSVANQSRTVSVGAVGSERRVVNVAAGTGATDAVNKAQLDAEAQARIVADVGLANDLATEAATRAQVDTALNQRIAAEETARAQLAADLQSEANARAAADLSLATQIGTLGGQVDALAGRVDTLESRVDKLDRKMAASTAVAVAMGGNAFLPDMKFNLTANVATYDGAQAGAFQMGAMVSDNVAVNAGVATSFNKGGKVAGRVGFTVGW